ncbi:MAG: TlpA disulfide reductase family protein [Bacteroidota bacterium]
MKLKKELREWGVFAVIILTLYLTGLHTNVAAFAQRVILETGLITASTELPERAEKADYDFLLKDLEGNEVNLSEFKDKVIFMNIWATWCPPCIAEMPNIQSLYNKVDNDDIVFVMLSMDNDLSKVQRYISKKEFTFPVYMAASRVPDVYRAPSIPTTLVISPEGKIISKKVGMANYDKKSFLNFLLKNTSSESN